MEEMTIQSATKAVRMAPVRSSTNSKLEEERLGRKSLEEIPKAEEKKEDEEPSKIVVETAVSKINDYVEKFNTKVGFSINSVDDEVIIIVTDKETGKVIREIPSEEILALNQKMEEITGIIFDEVG